LENLEWNFAHLGWAFKFSALSKSGCKIYCMLHCIRKYNVSSITVSFCML
jgi:hypothetical protein